MSEDAQRIQRSATARQRRPGSRKRRPRRRAWVGERKRTKRVTCVSVVCTGGRGGGGGGIRGSTK
jgi:hypothetical protein